MVKTKKPPMTLEALEVVRVPLMSIHGNDYNPNKMTGEAFELLCMSIREDGYSQYILVHRDTREIIDGFHRWSALQWVNQEDEFKGIYDKSISC